VACRPAAAESGAVMAWIELHQSLPSHRKTLAVADALNLPEYAVVGLLACLWLWALDNAPDGSLPDAPRRLARAIRYDGDADALVGSLLEAGFLHRDGDRLTIHNWQDYAGKLMGQRAKNAERQARFRERQKGDPDAKPEDAPDQSPELLRGGDVTVTSPPRNPATVPYQTVPNLTIGRGRADGGTPGYAPPAAPDRHEEGTLDHSRRNPTAARGSRLPEGWQPPPEALDRAAAEFPALDVGLATEEFRDYWRAVPGAKGVKCDWLATWRNALRKAQDAGKFQRGPGVGGGRRYPNAGPIDAATVPAGKSPYRELT
jgi:hypothetical protein